MRKPLKIALISLSAVLILGFVGTLIAKSILTSKIETFLSNSLPEHMQVKYESLNLSVLRGSLNLERPTVTIRSKSSDTIILVNEISSIEIDDFGYWNYLLSDKITIKNININEPKITFHYHKTVEKKKEISGKSNNAEGIFQVKNINILNGNVSVFDIVNDSLIMKINNFNIKFKDIYVSPETLNQKIPYTYSNYNIDFKNLFYSLNEFENLKVGKTVLSSGKLSFDNFNLYTKHSKQQLSNMISIERDHVNLNVDNLSISDEKFGYHKDSIFYFKSPKIVFTKPVFNIYRDKLEADDATIKSLYNRMLRDLKFDLTLSEILLKNGSIIYSEKVKPDSEAGELSFTKLNATIINLGNTYSVSENTDINIDAIFMKSSPIKVNWYFNVNTLDDHFVFKAEIGKLPAQDLNPFSEPNLNVLFEGELQKTFFTIDGNMNSSSVDLRTNYDNFKVTVLDKEGKNKNKFLSAIANLIIKKDSDKEADNYREGSKSDLERDKTKSVFNFIWLNAKAGLLGALTGSGKK